jgi:hypothetical protein
VRVSRHDVIAIVVLMTLALSMYAYRAQDSPPTATEQPMSAAVDLLSARAGHDAAGRLLPVFVQVASDRWLPPVGPYTTWATTTVWHARQPARRSAALFGALGVGLMYIFAMGLFRHRVIAWIAAALFLTNPAYLSSARSGAADGVWTIPALSIALMAAVGFTTTRSRRSLAIAAAALTACVYTQPSGAMLAFIAGVTLAVGFSRARLFTSRDALITAGAAAAAAAAPIALWFIVHPSSYADTLGRWFLHPAYIRHPGSLAIRMMNWTSLAEWASIYWSILNPTRLLYGAGAPGSAGTFLMPMGVFLAVAGYELAWPPRQRPVAESALLWIVAVAFAASPLVPASFSEPDAIGKALSLPLFGTILCALGVRTLWTMPPAWARVAVVLLLGLAAVQFLAFYSSLTRLAA